MLAGTESVAPRPRVLLVDAHNLFRRTWEAITQGGKREVPDVETQAKKNTRLGIDRAVGETAATHLIVVFDSAGLTWRHELYPDYKATRKAAPQGYPEAIEVLRDELQAEGVLCVRQAGVEADDLIASIATQLAQRDAGVVILSTDKDFLGLVGPNIVIRHHASRTYRDVAWLKEKYGVTPRQFPVLMGFVGDSADNIPGLPGFGAKTAAGILERHGSLEEIDGALDTFKGKRGQTLREGFEALLLYVRLVTLRTDFRVGLTLSQAVV